MDEYEFLLEDRIAKIKAINEQYDLENNAYISFSGGKDSTVLHYLIDMALPNNKIPRVYKDTGIEYRQMRKFVRQLCKKDSRFIYIKPNKNIKNTLSKVGYPFKSKQHSHNFQTYKNNIEKCEEYKKKIIDMKLMDRIKEDKWTKEDLSFVMSMPKGVISVMKYYFGFRVKEKRGGLSINSKNVVESLLSTYIKIVPNTLKYQFEPEYARTHNWSDKCCLEFKKGVLRQFEKQYNRGNVFTGMRAEEGGNRSNLGCITQGQNGKHFNLLIPITEDWEQEFIKRNNIELCELYYEPYNFDRTGCLFCPYSKDLQQQLDKMKELDKATYKQAEIIWQTSYDEYRRIGYRLRKKKDYEQISIFDFIKER